MKTTKNIIIPLFALLLATACGKEGEGIRLFAEPMTAEGGISKLLFDPADIDDAEWTAGETIDINSHPYSITGNSSDGYRVNASDDLGATLYAIYPGSSFGGNDVEVTNRNGSVSEVVLKSLVLNFHDSKHDVVFPMATPGVASDASEMTFAHLTGGLKLTLINNTVSSLSLGSVKIVTYGDNTTAAPIAARSAQRHAGHHRWRREHALLQRDALHGEGQRHCRQNDSRQRQPRILRTRHRQQHQDNRGDRLLHLRRTAFRPHQGTRHRQDHRSKQNVFRSIHQHQLK